jgi:hypothetical protein
LPALPLRLDQPNGPSGALGAPSAHSTKLAHMTEESIGHHMDWDHLTEASPGAMGMDLTPATVPALPLLPVVAPLLPPQISPPRRSVVFPALAALLVVVIVGLWVTLGGSRSQRTVVSQPLQPVPSPATIPQVPRGMQTMAVMHTPNPDRVGGASAEPASFTLSIDSTPPDATVIEGGKPIGSTPMVVTIDRRSVSVGPRRFLLRREGYAPFTLEQGDSKIAVSASATLSMVGRGGRDRPRRALSKRAAAASVAQERPTPPADTSVDPSPESGAAPAPRHGGGPALEIRTRR